MSKYLTLKFLLFLTLLRKGKIRPGNLWNTIVAYTLYFLKTKRSAAAPVLINFELSNNCNENCVFCRTEKGEIYDLRPGRPGAPAEPISKGTLDFEIFKGIIEQVAKKLLVAVPYVNGEPFIYKRIEQVLAELKQRRIGSIISTNGILLNDKNIDLILTQDLDLIKIHVSGFTNQIHQIQHRVGDIEVIKNNLRNLRRTITARNAKIIVLIDYIEYKHNQHELHLFKKFASELGFEFNVRPGNPKGMEASEGKQPENSAEHIPCDFLWKALTVNWNGDLLPCCDYVVWSDTNGYATYNQGSTDIKSIWNGPKIQTMRTLHQSVGRSAIDICANCNRCGIEYKY
jgi:radical SAM protein with 4Fe4S-binding SPASM domain